MFGLNKEELYKAEQKFFAFLDNWANDQGKFFKTESCDAHETVFDGMDVVEVWGWLLDTPDGECTDENFGCVEWEIKDGKLILNWNDYK